MLVLAEVLVFVVLGLWFEPLGSGLLDLALEFKLQYWVEL